LSILTDVVGYSPWKLGDHPVLASLAGLIPALLARRNQRFKPLVGTLTEVA